MQNIYHSHVIFPMCDSIWGENDFWLKRKKDLRIKQLLANFMHKNLQNKGLQKMVEKHKSFTKKVNNNLKKSFERSMK